MGEMSWHKKFNKTKVHWIWEPGGGKAALPVINECECIQYMWMFMPVHVFLYIFLWLDVSLDSINIHVCLCTTSHFQPLDSYVLWFSAQHMFATASSYQWYFTLPLLCVPTSYLAVPVPTSVSTCFLLICRPLIFYSFHAGFILPFLIVWLFPLCTPLALFSVLFVCMHPHAYKHRRADMTPWTPVKRNEPLPLLLLRNEPLPNTH